MSIVVLPCLAVGKLPSLCFFAYFVRLVVVSVCVMYIEEHLDGAAFGEYHVENNTFQIKRKFNQTSEMCSFLTFRVDAIDVH